MSSYRKTMGEAYNGMYLVEGNIDKIKDIVSKKKATKIDGVMVDLFTASAISQVYDKAGSSTKKKMEILPITKLASVVMKMMGSITNPRKMKNDYVPEELDLDEIDMNMVAFATFGFGAMVVLPGIIALDMLNSHTDGGVDRTLEKIINGLKSKLKKDKNYKPSSTEIDASKKLEKQIKKDEPSLYKKAMAKVKSISSKIKKEDLDEGTWHIAKNMNALKKKMQKPIPKNDLMVKFVMKHIGDDELADEMFDAKTGTDMVPMIKSAMKRLNIKEEVEIDEASKEGTVKIIKTKDGKFQIQKMTKGKFVDIGKPHNSAKEAEKFRSGQPDLFGEDYVLTVKGKEVNRYKSEKDARKAFHDLVQQHGHRNVKVFKEETDLDEAILKPGMTMKVIYKGKKVQGKVVRRDKGEKGGSPFYVVDVGGIESIKVPDRINSGYNEEADLDEASARGDAKRSMSRDRDLGRKDDLDKDDAASDDDVKAASKNIMMQLRKAANLRGTFAVEFGDKKKVKVDPKVAQAAASKYNSLRRPADKEKFQSQIAKSYKDMLKAIKEAVSPAQQAAIAISKKERGEKPKKESKFNTINKQLKGEK